MKNEFYKLPKDLLNTNNLNIYEKVLLVVLLDAWERRYHKPFQYQLTDLSENTGICLRTVRRAKDVLVDKGILTQTYKKRENGAPGKCTLYSINECVLDFVLNGQDNLSTEDKILNALKKYYGACDLEDYLILVVKECGGDVNDHELRKLIRKIYKENKNDIENKAV